MVMVFRVCLGAGEEGSIFFFEMLWGKMNTINNNNN